MPETTFKPNPEWAAKQASEKKDAKDDRDCNLAAEILRSAVLAAQGQSKSADQITQDAEAMWKWVQGD